MNKNADPVDKASESGPFAGESVYVGIVGRTNPENVAKLEDALKAAGVKVVYITRSKRYIQLKKSEA